MIKSIDPQHIGTAEMHGYLLGAVSPRPIAFASTIDAEGKVNLSPFSFFNCFSANPPILVFSPSRRVRDNTIKHTLENVLATKEVVINCVNFEMVEQMSLASTEYDRGIDEFVKSGLTAVASRKVKPPRVAESPVSFECRVNEVVALGDEGGAGNLVIAEVLMVHIKEEILDEAEKIDPFKMDAVARLGGNWYSRASGASLFEIPKPIRTKGMGVDALPQHIRESDVLSGNHLGRLGNTEAFPDVESIKAFRQEPIIRTIFEQCDDDKSLLKKELHLQAKKFLEKGETDTAWKTLLQIEK